MGEGEREREREREREEGREYTCTCATPGQCKEERRKWLVGEMSGRIHPINISTACRPAYHNKTNTTI